MMLLSGTHRSSSSSSMIASSGQRTSTAVIGGRPTIVPSNWPFPSLHLACSRALVLAACSFHFPNLSGSKKKTGQGREKRITSSSTGLIFVFLPALARAVNWLMIGLAGKLFTETVAQAAVNHCNSQLQFCKVCQLQS